MASARRLARHLQNVQEHISEIVTAIHPILIGLVIIVMSLYAAVTFIALASQHMLSVVRSLFGQ
jgi:hypothetical protein